MFLKAIRKQFNHLVFGGNGSGKTTWLIEVAIAYAEANEAKRVLWVLPDDSESKLDAIPEIELDDLPYFIGMAKIIVQDDSFFKEFLAFFSDKDNNFDGLVICDDCGVFIARRSNNILSLFRRRRQLNVDFIWSFHGFNTEVPKSFITYVNSIFIMETSDNPDWTIKQLAEEKQIEFKEKYDKIQNFVKKGIKYKCEELILRDLN